MKCSVVGVQLALCVLVFFVSHVALAPVDPKEVFTEKELNGLTEILTELLDVEGKLSASRLRRNVRKGKIPRDSDIKRAIQFVDKNHNGKIELDNFLKLYAEIKKKGKGKSDLYDEYYPSEKAFKAADYGNKGYLTGAEVREALKYVKPEITDAEIDGMMSHARLCGSDKVDLEGFEELLGYGPGSTSSWDPTK